MQIRSDAPLRRWLLLLAAVALIALAAWLMFESVLNATANSMMPNVRSTSSGRIMANSTIAAPRSSYSTTVAPARGSPSLAPVTHTAPSAAPPAAPRRPA